MNVLEVPTRRRLALVDPRLRALGGDRLGWQLKQRSYGLQSSPSVAYVIVSTESASVSESWGQLEDDRNRSYDPDESGHSQNCEFEPFLHSDLYDDACGEEDRSTSEISAFLNTVYDFAKRGKEDHAIDVIFEYTNNLLIEGLFKDCDRILAEVDLAQIPPVLMVSFLTITAAAKSQLKNRERFFKCVNRMVAKKRGPKAADRLLDGLD